MPTATFLHANKKTAMLNSLHYRSCNQFVEPLIALNIILFPRFLFQKVKVLMPGYQFFQARYLMYN
ncbi:hypothetical protein AV903_17365 [Erwinia tracheiphila]|uniref:Uncharacterized protein n=1 Tax=Erwinia tracheiphila TaxID=65700 RepID=A0A345CVD9_9GAMM|nr:hypothetical protein AV903_17365 [Erwinia tracheiphila]